MDTGLGWGRWDRDNVGLRPENERWCCAFSEANPWTCSPGNWASSFYRLEKWRDAALAGMEEALKARNGDPLQGELDNAMKRLGELTMENELLWARVRRPGPLAKRRSKK